jgi:hypothetical protein
VWRHILQEYKFLALLFLTLALAKWKKETVTERDGRKLKKKKKRMNEIESQSAWELRQFHQPAAGLRATALLLAANGTMRVVAIGNFSERLSDYSVI